MNKLTTVLLIALFSIANATPIREEEIRELSKLKPCSRNQPGTRVKHPSNDHKFLRCVSRDSFWIETCPDNLFYNADLDLCDWNTISLTTTVANNIDDVKFRPVLFRGNKTVRTMRPIRRRPLDLSRVSVKVQPDTELFPGQEDIVDTLTPVTKSETKFVRKQSKFVNDEAPFSRFDSQDDDVNFGDEGVFESKKQQRPVKTTFRPRTRTTTERPTTTTTTTTERPTTTTTTTERPTTTTERPTTTTERPVIRRPSVVRKPVVSFKRVEVTTMMPEVVEFPREKFIEREEEPQHHFVDDKFERKQNQIVDNDEEELMNEDKPVLIRGNHIVTSTKPTFVRRPSVRRPVKVIEPVETHRFVEDEEPRHEIIEEVPAEHEHEHEHFVESMPFDRHEVVVDEEPVREIVAKPTQRPTNRFRHHKIRTQLFKQLAEEIPGARVVSFNGRPVNGKF